MVELDFCVCVCVSSKASGHHLLVLCTLETASTRGDTKTNVSKRLNKRTCSVCAARFEGPTAPSPCCRHGRGQHRVIADHRCQQESAAGEEDPFGATAWNTSSAHLRVKHRTGDRLAQFQRLLQTVSQPRRSSNQNVA